MSDINESNYVTTSSQTDLPWPELLTSKPNFLQSVTDEIYRCTPLRQFKNSFASVCKVARDEGRVCSELARQTQIAFRATLSYMNTMLFKTDRFSDDQRAVIGQWIHEEFMPYCQLGTWPSRSYAKPQNIAGDHHTIQQIYRNADGEKRSVGHVINQCFLHEPACKAVVNRKSYIKTRLLHHLESKGSDELHIASIASGPEKNFLRFMKSWVTVVLV